ncbi:7579_t:CDS:2 [Diversispora eburnea]|uniref:7579_t:CDS:1 n=1 Tax=Diversispora eburnea TaxID=1213867 RepID=A0A9N9FX73_9GLOM|nr:7579_t:CDS:2 [Diversispora eburnea]
MLLEPEIQDAYTPLIDDSSKSIPQYNSTSSPSSISSIDNLNSIIISSRLDRFLLLVNFGVLLFVGNMIYFSLNVKYSIFLWHPILMSVVTLTSTEGIIVIQKVVKKNEKIKGLSYHKWSQIISIPVFIVGISVSSYVKILYNASNYYQRPRKLIKFIDYSDMVYYVLFGYQQLQVFLEEQS